MGTEFYGDKLSISDRYIRPCKIYDLLEETRISLQSFRLDLQIHDIPFQRQYE